MTAVLRQIVAVAREYAAAGLCVLPADRIQKRPLLSTWTAFQARRPTNEEIDEWFTPQIEALCLVCGAVSGDLEIIDFDLGGEKYEAWRITVEEQAPGLLDRLVIERTQSGGFHVAYRCESPVAGNTKLAQRRVGVQGPEEITLHGKSHKPRKDRTTGRWCVVINLIETRGEGGLFLCAPSPGYELIQGSFTTVPTITADERETLIVCAVALAEIPPEVVDAPHLSLPLRGEHQRPGDDFNERGEIREHLVEHGWTLARGGENEYWRRPGKSTGWSATLKGRVFYVHSTNAFPFEECKSYSFFSVYALLKHDGNYDNAARALRVMGYGVHANGRLPSNPPPEPPAHGVPPVSDPFRAAATTSDSVPRILTARQLLDTKGALREPIIEGLLRRGETMNIIAPPKSRKSWLLLQLIISLVTGRPFLGCFKCTPCDVLLLDNELHGETMAHRIPYVVARSSLTLDDVQDRISVDCVRGRGLNIHTLDRYFGQIEPGRYAFIGLDAFYRFIPAGVLENDNGAMAGLYNDIDAYADRLGCCFGLVHHASKGNQAGKTITDVGAGAGAQSRAADTHLILREHEADGVMVLEAVTRSWAPVRPLCMRWEYPLWRVDGDLDPKALKGGRPTRQKETANRRQKRVWTVEEFVKEFISENPQSKPEIRTAARGIEGLSWRNVDDLIETVVARGLIHRWIVGKSHQHLFATVPQPLEDVT